MNEESTHNFALLFVFAGAVTMTLSDYINFTNAY